MFLAPATLGRVSQPVALNQQPVEGCICANFQLTSESECIGRAPRRCSLITTMALVHHHPDKHAHAHVHGSSDSSATNGATSAPVSPLEAFKCKVLFLYILFIALFIFLFMVRVFCCAQLFHSTRDRPAPPSSSPSRMSFTPFQLRNFTSRQSSMSTLASLRSTARGETLQCFRYYYLPSRRNMLPSLMITACRLGVYGYRAIVCSYCPSMEQ